MRRELRNMADDEVGEVRPLDTLTLLLFVGMRKENKMVRRQPYVLLLFTAFLGACMFGPLDESRVKHLVEAPSDSMLVGRWLADSFSTTLVGQHYDDSAPEMAIEFVARGSVRFEYAPDFIFSGDGQPLRTRLETLDGSWRTGRDGDGWGLELSFDSSQTFPTGANAHALLRKMDGEPVIIIFIGDPDSGDRLLFRRQTVEEYRTGAHIAPTSHVDLIYERTFPFDQSDRIEILSYPVRFTWDTVRAGENTYINDELIAPNGRVRLPKVKIKDRVRLDREQRARLFDALCNKPCAEDEKMVAACYDPRHAVIFYDRQGKAIAFLELCLECYQKRHTEGIPVQDLCAAKVNSLHQLFQDFGVTYFGGPEDWH